MEVLRKRGTYGKSKIVVHDLFDVKTLMPPTMRNAPSGRSTPLSEISDDPETSQQLRRELSAFVESNRSFRGRSPPSKSASPSVFDVEPSDDEMIETIPKTETSKRRKLAPKSSTVRADNVLAVTSSPASDEPLELRSSKSRDTSRARLNNRTSHTKKATSRMRQKIKKLPDPLVPDVLLVHPPLNSSQDPPPDLGSPRSEKSATSMASTKSTPKRKRDNDEDLTSDLSSPSQLEISSLRLTPNRHSRESALSNESKEREVTSRTPSKVRGRLIDRLDSPSKPLSFEADMIDSLSRPKKSRKLLSPRKHVALDDESTAASKESSQTRLTHGDSGRSEVPAQRIRTYGKQRTHLQDTLPGNSSYCHTSSQHSLQDLVSQVESLTANKSSFEIEDDTDDDDSAPRFKSIHELRHAGAANRFDRDLDTLFEDIDSGNKSIRIQALMSLVRKLQDKNFKAHVLVSGKLGRLTCISTPKLDLPSSVTLVLALWALAVAETATAHALAQIYECLLHLPPSLLLEERAISKIARDRKEKMSKLLIRDLVDFEQHVLEKSVKHEGQPDYIIVSRVYLRCIELTLRRIVGLAGRAKDPPSAVFDAVLDCVKHNLEEIAPHGERPELVESIRLLISWLEYTAATSTNVGHAMSPPLVRNVGTVLSEVMHWSKRGHPAIEQSSIKSLVELSKGNSAVCSRFAETPLLPTIVDIVPEYFSRLATDRLADQEGGNLNTVILALGCLLHLAEYSNEVRLKMMTTGGNGIIQVDRLVDIFNTFVDEAGESTTEARTRVLGPPFGWLCLLLCTLCLNDSLRRHISSTTQGDGLSRLLTEAETTFNHMKLIDEDSFVERFGKILDIVKHDTTI